MKMRACLLAFLIVLEIGAWEIQKEDRVILEPFFKHLLTSQDLGYVLLGEKPAIYVGYVHHLSWRHPVYSLGSTHYFDKRNQFQKKAWEVWQKYEGFVSDQFLFKEEECPGSPLCRNVFIINRKAFCNVVDENRDLFESALGRNVSGKILYEEAKIRPLFSVVLNKDEALLGVILGYGKKNSVLYGQKKLVGLRMFPENQTDVVSLPIFQADFDDPETSQLKKRYLKCQEKIKSTFLGDGGFDRFLKCVFMD